MKKTLLKIRSRLGNTFTNCFSMLALLIAYSGRYRCIFFLGEAKKTDYVTSENIKTLLKKYQ